MILNLVDTDNILLTICNDYSPNHRDTVTNVSRKVDLNIIKKFMEHIKYKSVGNNIIFCFDTMFEELPLETRYIKSQNPRVSIELRYIKRLLYIYLKSKGYKTIVRDSTEADDIIYTICMNIYRDKSNISVNLLTRDTVLLLSCRRVLYRRRSVKNLNSNITLKTLGIRTKGSPKKDKLVDQDKDISYYVKLFKYIDSEHNFFEEKSKQDYIRRICKITKADQNEFEERLNLVLPKYTNERIGYIHPKRIVVESIREIQTTLNLHKEEIKTHIKYVTNREKKKRNTGGIDYDEHSHI